MITVYDKNKGKNVLTLSIPLAFAKLAFSSLPDSVSKDLKKEGYKVNEIMNMILEEEELFKLDGDDSIIKIWVK